MAYIALIPLFAVLYAYSGLSFYQTSATHEPSYFDNKYEVGAAIDGAVRDAISAQATTEDASEDVRVGWIPPDIELTNSDMVVTFDFVPDADISAGRDVPADYIQTTLDVPMDQAGDIHFDDGPDGGGGYFSYTLGPVLNPTSAQSTELRLFPGLHRGIVTTNPRSLAPCGGPDA